jgi:uncharacterized protein YdcH (DUF465 family)
LAIKTFEHSLNPKISYKAAEDSVGEGINLVSLLEQNHASAQKLLGDEIQKISLKGNQAKVAKLADKRENLNKKFNEQMNVLKEKGREALEQLDLPEK